MADFSQQNLCKQKNDIMNITNIDQFDFSLPQKEVLKRLLPTGVDARIINLIQGIRTDDPDVVVFTVHIASPPVGLAVIKLINTDHTRPLEIEHNRQARTRLESLPESTPMPCKIPRIIETAFANGNRQCAILYQLAGTEHTKIFALQELLLKNNRTNTEPSPYLHTLAQAFLGNANWYNLPPAAQNLSTRGIYDLLVDTINWQGKDRIHGVDANGVTIASIRDRLHTKYRATHQDQPGYLFTAPDQFDSPRIIFRDQTHPNPIAYVYNPATWQAQHDTIHVWPSGICHGDLHSRNLICDLSSQTLYVIDWATMGRDQLIFFDHVYLELNILLTIFMEDVQPTAMTRPDKLRLWQEWSRAAQAATGFEANVQLNFTLARYALERSTPVRQARDQIFETMKDFSRGIEEDLWRSYHIAGVAAAMNFLRKHTLGPLEQTFVLYYAALHLEKLLDSMRVDWRAGSTVQINPWLFSPDAHPLQIPAPLLACIPTSEAIKLRSCLIGRDREINNINNRLLNRTGRAIVVMGERRVGKTSLLAVTKNLYTPQGFDFLDIDHARHWAEFSQKVQNVILPPGSQPNPISLDKLKRICLPHLHNQQVICIDELDVMFCNAQDDELYTNGLRFLDWLQNISPAGLFITLTGKTCRTAPWHPINPNFGFIPDPIQRGTSLSPLTQNDVDTMCRLYLPERTFHDDAIRFLFGYTWGHPFFLQIILKYLPDNENAPVSVTPAILTGAINEALSPNAPETEYTLPGVLNEHFTPAERYNFWRWAQGDSNIGPASFITPNDKQDAAELARRGYLKATNNGYCIHPCWRSWLRSRPAREFPPPESLAVFASAQPQQLHVYHTGYDQIEVKLNGARFDFGPAGWLLALLCHIGSQRLVTFLEIAALGSTAGNGPVRSLDDANHAFEYIESVLENHGLNTTDYVEIVMNQGFRLTKNVVCND